MKKATLTKTRQRTRATEQSRSGVDTISKNSIVVMGAVSAVIGLWAAVSFVSAMLGSGGPLELARNWFNAIMGM